MRKIRDEQKGLIFILLILVLVIAVSIFFIFSLHTNEVKEYLKKESSIRMLILVEDEDSKALFSTVLLYYPSSKKGALLNLPGYTGAIYESLGRVDRLDSVYNEAGISAFKSEVEKLLGITIPFYNVISLEDFIHLSDVLSGMRVFIPSPIDCSAPDGERWLLPSGAVNLDGDKISIYLRYRLEDETEADLQERYQNVMSAFFSGLHDKRYILFEKGNFKKICPWFKTDLKYEEEEYLFATIADIDTESIIHQSISGSVRNVEGHQLLFPLNNGENLRNSVKQVASMLVSGDGSFTSRVYVLEIQNGTNVQHLARDTQRLFQQAGYDVLPAVNADSNDYEETVIIDHIGDEESAKTVGAFIHCTNIVQSDSSIAVESTSEKASVDFTIILGKDFNGQYVVKRRNSR
ncbi:MAG: LCP family protein [Treponema sp.]|nr:LCP family protein [Treponema sp.]